MPLACFRVCARLELGLWGWLLASTGYYSDPTHWVREVLCLHEGGRHSDHMDWGGEGGGGAIADMTVSGESVSC